jgi:protein-disulfide isomerase
MRDDALKSVARLWLLGALWLLPWCASAKADPFTPAQRGEIVQIMRDALRHDPTILRDAVVGLQADDRAQQKAAHADAIAANRQALLADPADPVAGDAQAVVSVVEFYDPRCPYCKAMLPILAELLRRNPQVRLIYKDLPVLGPASLLQSRALLAAARQGGYEKLQSALMHAAAGNATNMEEIRRMAQQAGLEAGRLVADMQDPAIQAHIDANLRLAQALHVDGTPALIVGDQMQAGATDLPELQQMITTAHR